ncbi:MMPL family transporter [Budvicia aquatica]|uniref:MMPL family transporter n=1 Tax=Budvicia aquatica TaxID=82979 RepID=UPI00208D3CBD|nr:MMPL family transporter [Budvicia aquatica]GKX52361.1 membrane protein [Budvicia aquatica]
MKNAIFRPEIHRRLAFGWLVCVISLLIGLAMVLPHSKLNSSVMALLPKEQSQDVPPALQDGFNQRIDRQLVWLVSPPKGDDLEPATWWQQQLEQLTTFQQVAGRMTEQRQSEWGKFFFDNRYALLDDVTRTRLANNGQFPWIISQIYSPFAGVGAKEIANDPLLITRSAQMTQQQNSGPLKLSHGWLTSLDSQGRTWYLLHGELSSSSYDIQSARQTVEKLEQLKQQLQAKWPGTELLQRGTLFYSDYASQQAQHDISTIGTASGLGIILLILYVFRSLKPLWLTLLSLLTGVISGSAAVFMIFGEVHIMTLVMSTSVVGISIDYALHYLTERMVHGHDESPLVSMKKLFPALLLAVISSSIAYLLLFIAPFPGLQQLAIFAAAGLTGAFLTVICWYPILSRSLPVRSNLQIGPLIKWLALWQHKPAVRIGIPLLALIATAIGFSQLKIDDDIRKLQALPPHFQQHEQQIASLTGQHSDQKWFLVYGNSPEQTLQRLEVLHGDLDKAKDAGWLAGYRLFPFPSEQRQQQNIALLKQLAPEIIQQLQQAGINASLPEFNSPQLKHQDWLNSVASEGWRLLWLSLEDGTSAVLVPVNGVTNPAALQQIATNGTGVHWVDKHTEFSTLFSVYRQHLTNILAAAVCVIGALFIWRFGPAQGLRCIIPTILSLGVGLAALSLSGQSLNLFSMLALVLVLGIGIDYTLFFSNPAGTPSTSMLSILMAALTTELSFGLLALSNTQAISGFGLILSGGILTAFILSPLALPQRTAQRETR